MFPTPEQLLKNFLSCINWEEKYLYIIDLGKILPEFPKSFRKQKYLVSGCQSRTWIALDTDTEKYPESNHDNITFQFYGDSDSTIIKGIIMIIFSLYQNSNTPSIVKTDVKDFLNQIKLDQHLTIARLQGVFSVIYSIQTQINHLMLIKNL